MIATAFPVELLKEWFLEHRRDLPWRRQPTPYEVWISEVMLQQTQVSVVIPYYLKWMKRFPSVEALAQASLEEVFKAWEGLGYYTRARNLHAAARVIVEQYEGIVPSEREKLMQIKGLGPYTVGAILSFAYHQRLPTVDANVLRVLARYFGIQERIDKSATQKAIYAQAEALLPQEEPWLVNEALIELGATVCMKKPHCALCPLRVGCTAYQEQLTDKIPVKGERPKTTLLHRTVAVILCEEHLLVEQGKPGELFAGLFHFPFIEAEGMLEAEVARAAFEKSLGLSLSYSTLLPGQHHSFTRYRALLYPYLFLAQKREKEGLWMRKEELLHSTFTAGHRTLLKHLLEVYL